MFIILAGPSGSGKNTVINELLKRNKNLRYLKSCTTRQDVRSEEIERSPYIRLSKEEFEAKVKNNELFEHEEIHGNYYGILKSSIQDLIEGKNDYIKDLGVLGQRLLAEKLKNKTKVVSIFLNVPKKELIKRLKIRGEQDIEKRMSRVSFELSFRPNFNLVIPNNDLEKTVQIIENILNNR